MKYCPTCNSKFDDNLSFCPKDGEVLEEDPGSLVGSVLDGQYQIEVLLGKGGMGAVYRARHILLGDRVAIKVLPQEMRGNTEWLRRFQREGQAARRFRHPNAVTVYDLRTSADGTIYLVMEYVEGNTLDVELKKRGRFSPAEAMAVMTPVMGVLDAAHDMGVVHRDLKPENIMIGKPATGGDPFVKLLDLGIAKLREVAGAEKTGNTNLTIAGQMLGTPYYMSPEQWGELPKDGNAEIDGRADIYSLGVVFYEIISGRRPFRGSSLPEVRREHLTTTPLPLHESAAGVSEEFSRAISRSLAKDRSDRQATAGELQRELVAALSEQGVSAASLSDLPSKPGAASRGVATSPQQTAATLVTGIGEAKEAPEAVPPAETTPTVMAVGASPGPPIVAAGLPGLAPAPLPPLAASEPRRKSSAILFAGLAVVLVLIVIGVGGYLLFRSFIQSPAGPGPATAAAGSDNEMAPGHEIGRYWLQVHTTGGDAVRAGERLILGSGQQFKFHFSPSENGYLYIIGPGNGNVPTTFLTAKPAADFGVATNEIKSGRDFTFPADTAKTENWFNLDQSAGADEFTVFFSTKPLAAPSFFTEAALHELTIQEQAALETVIAECKPNLLGTEVVNAGASPFVSVKVPQTAREGAPVVFKVRIEHK